MEEVKKILIITAFYLPGYKSGGPQQTIMNLVDVFGKDYEFHILTHNHDFGDNEPYDNVTYDSWNDVKGAKVYYYSKESYSLGFLRNIIKEFSVVYLCEPYRDHSYKVLLLNKLGKVKGKVILAPMGCFSENAISQKSLKKKIFWRIFRLLRLDKNIFWSLTSSFEKNDLVNCLGEKTNYYIAEDLPRRYVDYLEIRDMDKRNGRLSIIFLSRICPMKNLKTVIKIISNLKGDIVFDIYGILEDKNYWEECLLILKDIPKNIKWRYCGPVLTNKVVETFSKYDVFIFPTLGENFGHVIYESLMAGCVPVISDNTSWQDFNMYNCGKIISLNNIEEYITVIQHYVNNSNDVKMASINAMNYAKNKYNAAVSNSGYIDIFDN